MTQHDEWCDGTGSSAGSACCRRATEINDPAKRCDADFYCGECPDCLSGDHPENRPRAGDA